MSNYPQYLSAECHLSVVLHLAASSGCLFGAESEILVELFTDLLIRCSAHWWPVPFGVMATAEWLTSEQQPQSLFAAWSAPEIIPLVLNRAHGRSSHPLSLHYGNTIDPLLVTQGLIFVFVYGRVFPFFEAVVQLIYKIIFRDFVAIHLCLYGRNETMFSVFSETISKITFIQKHLDLQLWPDFCEDFIICLNKLHAASKILVLIQLIKGETPVIYPP